MTNRFSTLGTKPIQGRSQKKTNFFNDFPIVRLEPMPEGKKVSKFCLNDTALELLLATGETENGIIVFKDMHRVEFALISLHTQYPDTSAPRLKVTKGLTFASKKAYTQIMNMFSLSKDDVNYFKLEQYEDFPILKLVPITIEELTNVEETTEEVEEINNSVIIEDDKSK